MSSPTPEDQEVESAPAGTAASQKQEAAGKLMTKGVAGKVTNTKSSKLSDQQLQTLFDVNDPREQITRLANLLKKPDHESNLKSGAYVDFMFFNLHFCLEAEFSEAKTRRVVQLMDEVYCYAQETKWADLYGSFEVLKQGILVYCMGKDNNADCFSAQEVQKLTKFTTTSFFRYFRVYRFLHHESRHEVIVRKSIICEVPHRPPPLSAATQQGAGQRTSSSARRSPRVAHHQPSAAAARKAAAAAEAQKAQQQREAAEAAEAAEEGTAEDAGE